jgi:hypothetical protein
MAYLAAKAKGDNRMPLKRETPEDVYGRMLLQDPARYGKGQTA